MIFTQIQVFSNVIFISLQTKKHTKAAISHKISSHRLDISNILCVTKKPPSIFVHDVRNAG